MKRIFSNVKEELSLMKYRNELPDRVNNSDLFIVEYPKSGITWFTTVLANTCLIMDGDKKEATHFNLEQIVGDVHHSRHITQSSIFPHHRIIKSHANFNPYYRHVIYLIRNPYSVMVSYHKFALNNKFFSGSFDDFIRDETLGIKSWVKHVKSWINPQKNMKLHYIRYEDMIDKPNETIKKLYKNIGWNISEENIEMAISRSNFNNMKKLNNHYKEHCPFRNYDFVRRGDKTAEITQSSKDYIYENAKELICDLYPEL